MERIYGAANLPELRSSFETVLMVMSAVEKLDHTYTPKECQAKFDMLRGSLRRHFELQATMLFESEYEGAETHVDRHSTIEVSVDIFCQKYSSNTVSQNIVAFRALQKSLLHHLLMDDAHFVAQFS